MMGAATEKARLPRFSLVPGLESCCEVDDLWNNLPVSLRTAKCLTQFRSQLKTHLFKAAFT